MAWSLCRLLAALVLLGIAPADAADTVLQSAPRPAVVITQPPPPPVVVVEEPAPLLGKAPVARSGPLMEPAPVRFGCQRIWRCDTTICEWRRGCWGVYGYVETPYYTAAFAKRQWESHGLPSPQPQRRLRKKSKVKKTKE